MQCDAFDVELAATLAELRGAVASAHTGQIRKQRTFGRQVFEQIQRLAAQVDEPRRPGFFADETHSAVGPVHVFAFQVRDVPLTRAQMPA